MLYDIARSILFKMDAERAHGLAMDALEAMHTLGLAKPLLAGRIPSMPVRAMGLEFPNPVGLAAGLDKNAEHVDALADLGFGFLELGGVTPRPQPGNAKPRLFRVVEARAVINRFGFNSVGVEQFAQNLARARYKGILGVNLGKNLATPLEDAVKDYAASLERVYTMVHFATINVSSPNTKNLRQLQQAESLRPVLADMHGLRERLAQKHGRRVALAVKISPDLDDAELKGIAHIARDTGMDAVIAANTTTSRDGVAGMPNGDETGGLSGEPLRARATDVVGLLARELDGAIPVIGGGGIMNASDARDKLAAGATLVQIYSGMVYRGPGLAGEILRGLAG